LNSPIRGEFPFAIPVQANSHPAAASYPGRFTATSKCHSSYISALY
jgi:hypothetical protein